ncbi:MAG: NADH dehydrogenase (quinone) subunit D [Verrucomicrobia bacterium GWC2_42_7]|nr:MAG: NADH dehydrogenase (quinone) subunit D [Verrucomicrobia bacterium GWC2_42_7]
MNTPSISLEKAIQQASTSNGRKPDRMVLNIGPSHPATHGVLRLELELDGDLITKCEPIIGHLHRGMEKIAESCCYNQYVPYTDRLDYLAPLHNNVTYALAVEKLANIQTPPRCEAIRVIICELARISSHLLGLGVYAMDAGATTVFLYAFTQREKLYSLFEELTGARLTTSYTRIGGLTRDLPEGWLGRVNNFNNQLVPQIDEIENLLTHNKIWIDRTQGIGIISRKDAVSHGLTGPNLRASGIALDLRKDNPYLGYENYHFTIPIGAYGDCYDRYLVRLEEIRQSIGIIRQVIHDISEEGFIDKYVPQVLLPPKGAVLTRMEELVQQFMLITQGSQVPAGECYFEAENPKGVLGFFIVSNGGGVPFRLKIRSPSFSNLSILPKLVPGHLLSDITMILGSLDFVMGECDR